MCSYNVFIIFVAVFYYYNTMFKIASYFLSKIKDTKNEFDITEYINCRVKNERRLFTFYALLNHLNHAHFLKFTRLQTT